MTERERQRERERESGTSSLPGRAPNSISDAFEKGREEKRYEKSRQGENETETCGTAQADTRGWIDRQSTERDREIELERDR